MVELRDRLLAVASRELRRPLASLTQLIVRARREAPMGHAAPMLDEALTSAAALRDVVDDLVEMMWLDTPENRSRTSTLQIKSLLDSVRLQSSDSACRQGVRLDFENDLADRAFELDARRLRRALALLTAAAIGNAQGGDVRIHARLQPTFGTRSLLSFEVTAPMPDQAAIAAWRRSQFDEAGPDDDAEDPNSGLAMARRLSELMRGETGVKLLQGFGAVFWLRVDANEAIDRSVGGELVELDDLVAADPMRVMLAAPDATMRFFMEEAVRSFGWEAHPAPAMSDFSADFRFDGFDLIMLAGDPGGGAWNEHMQRLAAAARRAKPAPLLVFMGAEDGECGRAGEVTVFSHDAAAIRTALLDSLRVARGGNSAEAA
jgi:hypothetical protein